MSHLLTLHDLATTERFAHAFAAQLSFPMNCHFVGDIGSGKTTLIRYLLRALGVTDRIKSPTFSLVECYQVGKLSMMHTDLYRVTSAEELEDIGFIQLMADSDLVLVEWPYPQLHLPPPDLCCTMVQTSLDCRDMRLSSSTERGSTLVQQLSQFC